MKIVYTLHTIEKIKELKLEGWNITKRKLKQVIKNPKWRGKTKENQETVIGLADEKHILRIVVNRKSDIIKVITFHLGKRGRYESTLR